MTEEEVKNIFDDDNSFKTDGIWVLSILMLLFLNRPENEKPIINIYIGDE